MKRNRKRKSKLLTWDDVAVRGVFAGQSVPSFVATKALAAAKSVWATPSNPKVGRGNPVPLNHAVTVFVGWHQLEEVVLPRLVAIRKAVETHVMVDDADTPSDNKDPFKELWNAKPHRALAPDTAAAATRNTWRYLYASVRSGVFVRMSGGRVAVFAPFVNPHFRNNYRVTVGAPSLDAYVAKRNLLFRHPEDVDKDVTSWWVDGPRVHTSQPLNYMSDAGLGALRDVLDSACDTHTIPDVEFFINLGAYPVVPTKLCDGASHAPHMKPDGPPPETGHAVYAPVMSCFSGPGFADVVVPCPQDWELAQRVVFPSQAEASDAGLAAHSHADSPPWDDREPKAAFRGLASGGGTTPLTNLRLAVAAAAPYLPDHLDAGITGWDLVNKIPHGEEWMTHVDPGKLPFSLAPFAPPDDLRRYKYRLFIPGCYSANRLSTLMSSGSLLIWVVPPLGDDGDQFPSPDRRSDATSWVSMYTNAFDWVTHPKATPPRNADHIVATVDQLKLAVEWARKYDASAKRIAATARRKALKLCSAEVVTAYWRDVLVSLHRTTQGGAATQRWFEPVLSEPVYYPQL